MGFGKCWDSGKVLRLYIHDYMKKKGLHDVADIFSKEANIETFKEAPVSKPEVGSSMTIIKGFATSSTATVRCFCCSVESPLTPGKPTTSAFNLFCSTLQQVLGPHQ